MRKFCIAVLCAAAFTLSGPSLAAPPGAAVVVAVPAQAGPVDGMSVNSDQFIWQIFTQFTAPATAAVPKPVVFETWASDSDTFTFTPHWPGPQEPHKFQTSVLSLAKGAVPALRGLHATAIDAPCNPPPGAATGNFPTSGTPTPCIAEEVKRNHPQYSYIVDNKLNTQPGLAAAYGSGFVVTMPTDAISVKGDWVPVQTILQWVPQLGSIANVEKSYYTTTTKGQEYGLVALHVSSRQNPNWVWGTFEHQYNPGRCDQMGCYDTFGATEPAVFPNKQTPNTQYGTCTKTAALQSMMASANLSPVWQNYCLKSSEVDYSAADGTPYVLGSSVIERITGNGTVAASSCIACHVYASFGSTGAVTAAAENMLPYNPTGAPLQAPLANARQYDFMWGVLLAPAKPSAALVKRKPHPKPKPK
jgi:hypothetical protein